ncbi:hypothetical protein FHN55_12620 [Streptomyces sp. NP160]|uniref:hypothetical protein n=1 Tax=Streptomyces sp. NP160 TaxID=2586637 RepID=UPI001118041D|nr:hypothetical protein [Streptomyces sp. NP160]TNM64401.1 hypothetical protein FHN55_12620 [Streptomyces sp. NP160]
MAGRRSVVGPAAAAVVAALVVVLGAGLVGAAPARAATSAPTGPTGPTGPTAVGSVPPQVQAAYDGEFLRRMVTSTHGPGGTVSAGTVHQLFSFTEAFQEGDSDADPVEAGDAWIAAVEVDGVVVGWQRTFLDDAGDVRSSGWSPDPVGARPFLETAAGALVEVPWDGAFFTLVDGVVTPMSVQSWDAGLGPRSLAQVQADFAVSRAETAAAYACCTPADACAGGGGAAVGGGGGGGAGDAAGDRASCGTSPPRPEVLALAGAAVALAVGVGWAAVRQGRQGRLRRA